MRNFNKTLDRPDERRDFNRGHVDVVNLDGGPIGRAVFEPGWKWSNDVKPLMGTESCDVEHGGVVLKGTLVIRMDSGEEFRIKAGEAFRIPAGHDAWVEGNAPCELVDVIGFGEYAVSKKGKKEAA